MFKSSVSAKLLFSVPCFSPLRGGRLSQGWGTGSYSPPDPTRVPSAAAQTQGLLLTVVPEGSLLQGQPGPKQPCVECPAATGMLGPSLSPAWSAHQRPFQQKQAGSTQQDWQGPGLRPSVWRNPANRAEPQTITGHLSRACGVGSGAVDRGRDSLTVDCNAMRVQGGLCTASLARTSP